MHNFIFSVLAEASTSPSVFTYFSDSNFAGKVIVILLMFFSVLAWSVMIGKYSDLDALQKENLSTERKLASSKSIIEAVANFGKTVSGPYASLLREAVAAWSRYDGNDNSTQALSLRMGLVENALQRAVSRQTIKYESKMVLLGSIISGAPFLGLLGTVWGVMDSFGAMSMQESATLKQLAPGVSGALLTTVAGLVVAIPSVFGYNFLLTRSKAMVNDLENFASSLADKIELESRVKDIVKQRTVIATQNAPQSNMFTRNVVQKSFSTSVNTQAMNPQVQVATPIQSMPQAPVVGEPKEVFDFGEDENSGPVPPRRFED